VQGALQGTLTPPGGAATPLEGHLGPGPALSLVLKLGDRGVEEYVLNRPQNPLGQPQNPLARPPAPAWVGTWTGGAPDQGGVRLVAEVSPEGGLRGSLTVQGATYPVTGAERGGKVEGSFTVQGHAFPFTAEVQGDALVLTSEGAAYHLAREAPPAPANPLARPTAPANPLGQPAPGAPAPATPAPAPSPAGGPLEGAWEGPAQRVQHASGFSYDVPEGWSVRGEQEGMIVLDPGYRQGGTLEALVFLNHGEPDDADRAKTPVELLRDLGPQLMPQLQVEPAGEAAAPTPITVGGVNGAQATWPGRQLQNGVPVTLWAGGLIAQGKYVVVVALVQQGKEADYLPRAKRVLASVRLGQ
jgi:hypothetical protein